jgi:hypothetical protein
MDMHVGLLYIGAAYKKVAALLGVYLFEFGSRTYTVPSLLICFCQRAAITLVDGNYVVLLSGWYPINLFIDE